MPYEETESLRRQQERDGKRMTITAVRHPASREKRIPTNNGAPASPAKKPFVAVGHDAFLKHMQDSGGNLQILMISGRIQEGRVVNRDRYTITLEVSPDQNVTVYKHAIESYRRVDA